MEERTERSELYDRALRFDEFDVGMRVRFEHVRARNSADDEECRGLGTVEQVTDHIVVINNGKYRVTAQRSEMFVNPPLFRAMRA